MCSLGPAKAEDATMKMAALSFIHGACSLLMTPLSSEFPGYSLSPLWPLGRYAYFFPEFPTSCWRLDQTFFEHFAKILRVWRSHTLEITTVTGGDDALGHLLGHSFIRTFDLFTYQF